MGKNYTLYITPADFAEEPNKSGLVNELLKKHYGSPGLVTLLEPSTEPPQEEETDEYKPDYSNLVYDSYTNAVYDKETKEQIEATPEMTEALKKR